MGGRRIKLNLEEDYFKFREMNEQSQIDTLARLNKRANTRIKALRDSGVDATFGALGKINAYLKAIGRDKLYQGKDWDVKSKKFKMAFLQVTTFLKYESSTLKGMKQIEKRKFESFAKNYKLVEKLQEEHPELTKSEIIKKHMDTFYNFIKSNQFKMLRKIVDSKQLMEDFVLATVQGETVDQINEDYMRVISGEISFLDMQEMKLRSERQRAILEKREKEIMAKLEEEALRRAKNKMKRRK